MPSRSADDKAAALPNPDAAIHPTLVTSRLVLRPIVAEDVNDLPDAFADPETMRFMDFPPALSVADSARYLAIYVFPLPDWHATWALVCRQTRIVMGFVNYHHRETWNHRLEVGFLLGRPYWKRGLMSEALDAVLEYCFERLEIERVEVTMSPDNDNAVRLAERLGFQRESGLMSRRQRVATGYRDQSMYSLLRDEWRGSAPTTGQTAAPSDDGCR